MATLGAKSPAVAGQGRTRHGRQIMAILLLSVGYHWLLTFLQTNAGFHVTTGAVAAVELLVYVWVIGLVLSERPSIQMVAVFLMALGALFGLAVMREGFLDVKGIRDLLIPTIFYVLAATSLFTSRDERRIVVSVVVFVLIGVLIELLLADRYGRVFNTFNYHASIGTIGAEAAHYKGMDVTLNAVRPEGIGKTVMGFLVGQRRLSSVFVEPVSLGNFCVVIAAWLLAHEKGDFRKNLWIWAAVVFMALLSDSRFAMLSMGLLCVLRLVMPVGVLKWSSVVAPLVAIVIALLIVSLMPVYGDNLLGRLTASGRVLLEISPAGYMGLHGFTTPFGDMGYAYVTVHFGLPVFLMLWALVTLRGVSSVRHQRMRAMAMIYMAMILSVSGSSVFALKTAGVMWFLLGLGDSGKRFSGASEENSHSESVHGGKIEIT